MYTSAKVIVFDDQHDKLKNTMEHQKPISIESNLDNSGGQQKTSESKRTASRRLLGYADWVGCKSSSIDTRMTRDWTGIKCCETSGRW